MCATWLGLAFTRFRYLTDFQETNKCLFRHNIKLYLGEILLSARRIIINNAYKQTFVDKKGEVARTCRTLG